MADLLQHDPEVHDGVGPVVDEIGPLSQAHGLARQALGVLEAATSREAPGAHAPPYDLSDEVVVRRELGAHLGKRLGLLIAVLRKQRLPQEGRGSLASWRARIGALIIDWAACMAVAVGFFGSAVLTGGGWRAWMILTVFFVESTVLSWLAGGSFGQLLSRIAVARLDAQPLGLPRALLRALLVSLALPALIISTDRRGLQDLAAGTVVINRR